MNFVEIYKYFSKHRKYRNIALFFIVAICAVSALQIRFEEDISKMFRVDKDTEELGLLLDKTKSTEQLLMRIFFENRSAADKDSLIAGAGVLAQLIESQCNELINEVKTEIPQDDLIQTFSLIARNFSSFVNFSDSEIYSKKLTETALDSTISKYIEILATPGGIFAREALLHDPAGFTFKHLERLKEMQTASGFIVSDGYVFSKDENSLIIFIIPKNKYGETGNNSKLISRLNQITADFNAGKFGFENYKAQYFGAPLVAVGNSEQIRKDLSITVIAVLLCIVLLLVAVFGKKRMPLLIAATIGFAVLFSLALVNLLQPSISLIAIGSGAVILGIAANYPIHFFTHYMHNRSIEKTVKAMVFPMTIGSLTTVGGFLCLTLTGSPLLNDFGLFGAFCLVGAALFSLIFLPHFFGKIPETDKPNFSRRFFEKISSYPIERKPVLLILIACFTPIMLYFAFKVEYESDLSKLNYMSAELRETEQQFNLLSERDKTLTLISKGKNTEEALLNSYKMLLLTDSLSSAGIKCSYIGVSKAVPPKEIQQKNVDSWNNFCKNQNIDKENIKRIFVKNNLNINLFEQFFEKLDGKVEIIPEDDYRYLLDVFGKENLYSDSVISTLLSHISASAENLPLIAEIANRSADTKVLNKRVITENIVSSINDDFNTVTFYTSLLVFFAILLSYGRIELTLITFIPMLISWIWILGIMGLFGIKFNIVNIILSTFIFGLGDDFCIFTTDNCLKIYRGQRNNGSVTRMSIIISGFTALIGFCSLLFAKHPAIHSLAIISVLGILSVLFISQTLQPVLFRILISKPVAAGNAPISLLTMINGVFFFLYFFTGSLFLSLFTLILKILPMKRQRKKLILHYLIYYLCRSLFFWAISVKRIKLNPHNEDFKRPAIIIANHQSMVDILEILTLSPKIVFAVKDWVWKSPVMGVFVRFAGFHVLSDGLDSIENYSKTIAEGYSIVIFPEGSRSENAEIKRFHKGAFFLAEQLNLDILPIMIYNNNEILPKNSFMVYPTQMALKIYERISPENQQFGQNYKQRTKNLSAFYRDEYLKLDETLADSRHCTRKLRDGFMYKGPVLEWYLRIKLWIEDTYSDFEKFVPRKGKIIDAGCGYGFLAYTLAIKSHDREIVALDYDFDKIAEAGNCYLRTAKQLEHRLQFLHADLTKYEFEPADCVIFSDVLHYIQMADIERIAQKIAKKLNPDGKIIIRDADRKNHRFNKIAEFLSINLVKFNKSTNKLNFFTAEEICGIFEKYGFETEISENKSPIINTYWILRKTGATV